MKQVTTYLNFDGNCREAMQFYQECLEAELTLNPVTDAGGKPSAKPGARIMHSELRRDGKPVVLASDIPAGTPLQFGNNVQICVDCGSIEEIERLFAALVQNGLVGVPLADAPGGARFGMLTDQFGIQWILNCQK